VGQNKPPKWTTLECQNQKNSIPQGTLENSTVVAGARDDNPQPSASGSVAASAPAEAANLAESPEVETPAPSTPQDLLKEYEKQIAVMSLKTCEEIAQTVQAEHEGQIGPDQAEYLTSLRMELGMIRLQYLDSMHQILDDKIQKEAKQAAEVQTSSDTLIVPFPDFSPDVLPVIAKYLELTPLQVAAIQAQITEERSQAQSLEKELASNRRALLAATSKGQFDTRQVRELAEQQARILEPLIVTNARLQAEVYKLLTVEQRQKLNGMTKGTAGLAHLTSTE
jgi:Spy/CpxP family protein refolding chaperone